MTRAGHALHTRTAIRALFVLLLATLALIAPRATADDDRWTDDLPTAQRRAILEGKPLLLLFVAPGEDASRRFAALVDRNKSLQPLLDEFVCARLDKGRHADHVSRYHMAAFPAILFTTPGGRAMKLMVGSVNTAKVRGQAKEVLEKWETLRDPASFVPQQRPRNPAPHTPERQLLHPSTCPDKCLHCEPAVTRALEWIEQRQRSDGSWTKLDDEKETRTDAGQILTRSIDHVDIALTSLAGMALMADGSTAESGRFRSQVLRAARFVEKGVREDGIVSHAKALDWLYLAHSNFETPLAAMFLAEVQRASPSTERARLLQRIADQLAGGQDPRSGGWGYAHDSIQHSAREKRGWRLLATTYSCMEALAYLRDAGADVDPLVLQRGATYVRSCLTRQQTFAYRSELRGMQGFVGTGAGALFALSRAGLADNQEFATARDAHRRAYRGIDDFGEHWWWFLLHTGLLMHDTGEGAWRDFDAHFRNVLLDNQDEDGSWDDPDHKAGRVFATSIATLVLQLEKGHLPISSRRRAETPIARVATPQYLKPPHSASRVKVFEHAGRYLVDLIISVEGPTDDDYLAKLEAGVRGANRTLFDVTDGQLSMHHVRLLTGGRELNAADILITTEFYDDPDVPEGGAHGVTMVSKRTDLRGGREIEGTRIGEWVKLPYHLRDLQTITPWQNRGLQRVMAHELCHYIFGVQDEYGVGGVYCRCFMGDLLHSELCDHAAHTDDRRELCCWDKAVELYPLLRVPSTPDPGPWDPPAPIIEIVK